MLYHMATLTLAPVFLLQGIWVRRTTPRLPEPEGARSGVWGTGPGLRLLILGDSAAAGVGVASQADALSGKLVAALGAFHCVAWKLLAESGHDSAAVLEQLRRAPTEVFDVVVMSVGVNDVTGRTPVSDWLRNLHDIATLLTTKFQARRILFSSVPPMHVFPALPQPLRWWLGARAEALNEHAAALAHHHPHWNRVAIPFPFEPGYMATDGFHPGAQAYSLWGNHVAMIIREEWVTAAIVSR